MSDSAHEFLAALAPVVDTLGAQLVAVDEAAQGDEPVIWHGETVAYLRPNALHDALEHIVASVEREIGTPIGDMKRADKQVAIRRLDERGAFLLRGAAEHVATSMGVSKVTIYSYLNAIERANN